jgi:hypothetical protein
MKPRAERDGEVRLILMQADASPETGHALVVRAAYAHLDRWVRRAEPVSCEYPAATEGPAAS